MSTENLNGVIDSTYTKTVNTRYGDKPVYHVVVGGVDVNMGFKKHKYEEGETVNWTVENGKYGYEFKSEGGTTGAPTATAAATKPVSAGPRPGATGSGFPVPKGDKGLSICRQNAMSHATQIVHSMKEFGIIPAVMSEEDYMDKVLEIAYEVTDFTTGHRELNQAAALTAMEAED